MRGHGRQRGLERHGAQAAGSTWEQGQPSRARRMCAFAKPDETKQAEFEDLIKFATLGATKLTIQGGTTEILRGIIARGLGLR